MMSADSRMSEMHAMYPRTRMHTRMLQASIGRAEDIRISAINETRRAQTLSVLRNLDRAGALRAGARTSISPLTKGYYKVECCLHSSELPH